MEDDLTYDTQGAVDYFSEKLSYTISCSRLKEKIDRGDKDFQILDVRHKDAWNEGRIPGALFIDADDLENQWHLFSKDKINIIYCYGLLCHRGFRVCLEAAKRGYPVMDLLGNYHGWVNYPFEVEKG